MVYSFNSLHLKLIPSTKGFLYRCPNRLTQPVQSPPYDFFFNSTPSQIQIHYSVAHMGPSIANGSSVSYHRHYCSRVSIPRGIVVIHFVVAQQTQRSKLVFLRRTSCRWEGGKATQSIGIFPFRQPTPFGSLSQNSSILNLALHPRFKRHTLPHPNHECAIDNDLGVSLRRECQASWSGHSVRIDCQRLFSPTTIIDELKLF